MCEFKVLRKNEIVFKDAVYIKAEGSKVTVRDILGVSKVFENCTIGEVDVNKERLLLIPVEK
jgi:predicted RNA-binding protein